MPRMVTVVRPGSYPQGYQFGAKDYVSVPAIQVAGTFPLWQAMRLTADPRVQTEVNAQGVIRMMTDSFDRMRNHREKRT